MSQYNPFETARAQFDKVAEMLDLDSSTRKLLRNTMKEFHFHYPSQPGY